MTKMTLLSVVLAAGSAVAREPSQQTVTICLRTDPNPASPKQPSIESAELIADQILASAGVRLVWRTSLIPCTDRSLKTIQVDLSSDTPPDELPGALGFAQPFEDAYVRVFYDRIHGVARTDREPYLLGHVLAHEITHVLQGTNYHSASGVMKSAWDVHDFGRMVLQPLKFTDADVQLIRHGLGDRAALRPAFTHRAVEIAAGR